MSKISRLLIVDDDIDDREIFAEAVAAVDPNIKCFTAKDGEDALRKLSEPAELLPEVIFLDLNMPRMDGRQVLVALKKNDQLNKIPVVIYTTSSSARDFEETKALGAFRFLAKPSDFNELRDVLKNILFHEL
jgi:CheY-like chemotaxis protein